MKRIDGLYYRRFEAITVSDAEGPLKKILRPLDPPSRLNLKPKAELTGN